MDKCNHCGRHIGVPMKATHRDIDGNYWLKKDGEWFRFNTLTGDFHYRSRGRVKLVGMITL